MRASDEATERDLIRRLRAGDEDAFETMVKKYGGRMLTVARRFLRVEQDARDAVQEAVISAFRAIGDFAGEARLSTWLHRIVVNAALMQLRKRHRRNEESIEDMLPCFNESGDWVKEDRSGINLSDATLERRDTREMVRRCIDRLPANYRNVLIMRDIQDLDTQEVADMLGAHPNNVKVRLHRAHQALRTLVLDELAAADHAGRGLQPQLSR
jgi:RNA polymerase sigma-70 factor, ECF subfamily